MAGRHSVAASSEVLEMLKVLCDRYNVSQIDVFDGVFDQMDETKLEEFLQQRRLAKSELKQRYHAVKRQLNNLSPEELERTLTLLQEKQA
jgi:hypothetical protein